MKRNDQPRRTRLGLSALGVIGFAAFAMVAAPAPAEAGDRHHHHKYKVYSHGYRHVYGHTRPAVHYVAPPVRYVTAPVRLDHVSADIYRPYYWKRTWYAPHRHAHAIYRFPVATADGPVYTPYGYCGNRIFVAPRPVVAPVPHHSARIAIRTPHFSFSVGHYGH